jgi:hypothetical protein
MTTRDRLRETAAGSHRDDRKIDGFEDEALREPLTYGDARKLLALDSAADHPTIRACVATQRRFHEDRYNWTTDHNVRAHHKERADACTAFLTALDTLTHPEAPDA